MLGFATVAKLLNGAIHRELPELSKSKRHVIFELWFYHVIIWFTVKTFADGIQRELT